MTADINVSSKIAGGFVLVTVPMLMATWQACGRSPLGIGDFRTWLACREMLARRCALVDGRSGTYGFAELSRLTGVSEKRVKASVHRLVAAGLMTWSEQAIEFPDPGNPDDPGSEAIADTIGGGRGSLAIPRRILRLLAGGARTSLIATVLGLLLRCLSRDKGGFRSRGRVKASWIARVFGVDERRVKQARKDLIALGWLVPEESDQWALNRWGRAYRIALDWERAGSAEGRRLPPPPPADGPRLPPPDLHPEPLRELKNQEPDRGGPTGVEVVEEAKKNPLPPPKLADVQAEDLRDMGRLLQLHEQAIARDLIGSSEADRLRFVSAAEHARSIGSRNPPGLFVRLLRGRLWSYLTQDDEEAASRRLKAHLYGPPRSQQAGPSSLTPVRPRLAMDALMVREIRLAMARAGSRDDPFPVVRAKDPSWTRERWNAALEELEREAQRPGGG